MRTEASILILSSRLSDAAILLLKDFRSDPGRELSDTPAQEISREFHTIPVRVFLE